VDRARDLAARTWLELDAAFHPRGAFRAAHGLLELVALVGVEIGQTVGEGAGELAGKVAADVVLEHAPDDVDHLVTGALLQSGGKRLPLIIQMLLPGRAARLHVLADIVFEPGAQGGGLLPRLAQHLFPALLKRPLLLAQFLCLGLDLFARGLRFGQPGFDTLFPSRHGVGDGPVKEPLKQPDENEKVDDLGGDCQPVDLHGISLRRPEWQPQ